MKLILASNGSLFSGLVIQNLHIRETVKQLVGNNRVFLTRECYYNNMATFDRPAIYKTGDSDTTSLSFNNASELEFIARFSGGDNYIIGDGLFINTHSLTKGIGEYIHQHVNDVYVIIDESIAAKYKLSQYVDKFVLADEQPMIGAYPSKVIHYHINRS